MPILQPGQQFAEYRLATLLSRGGMGEVWRALKLGSGARDWSRQVALKVILPGFADTTQFTELFAAEARIAAGLVHANIVQVSGFGTSDGILFLEQELVDGADLERILARAPGGLPLPLAIFVVTEALKGLAYAHEHQRPDGTPQTVIHRDIKPANVLVAREGAVKLGDFGIAKVATASNQLTQLRGTIGYIAPEVFDGRPPSPRSDLFAMGLIFWELLTGHKLFDGEHDAVRLLKTYECVVPALADVGVIAPPAVEEALRRLLARDPAARFERAEDAIRALLGAPGGRDASSLDLKAYLESIGVKGLGTIDVTGSHKSTANIAGEVTLPRRLTRMLVSPKGLMLTVAAAAVGAGVAVFSHASRSTPTAPAPAAAAPAPAPAPPPPPAPAPAPARVVSARVSFAISPADAQLTVNGKLLDGPPYATVVPLGAVLAIHAERPGYSPVDTTVSADGEAVAVPISLSQAPAPPPAPEPARPRKHQAPKQRSDGLFVPE